MSDPRTAPSILTRGAVDLGALRSAPPPSATAAPSTDGPVFDVTVQAFQQDVLERSLATPVIVEFAQPGAFQPALEQLARESGGAWLLGRVDVTQDSGRQLAQMFRLQAVPTVYAVVGGQPVDAFDGVLPEPQLRQFLARVLAGTGVEVEVPEDPRYAGADEAMVNGDLEEAERAYRQILAEAPADVVAEAGLAQVELLRRVQDIDPEAALAAAEAAPDDVAAQTVAADVEVLTGEAGKAYTRLVDLVRRTAGAERDAARAHLLSLFLVAGPDDPAVATARRALASALY